MTTTPGNASSNLPGKPPVVDLRRVRWPIESTTVWQRDSRRRVRTNAYGSTRSSSRKWRWPARTPSAPHGDMQGSNDS
jgi:hypothetical protein